MLYNEQAVRANIRNREGKRVYYLGKGDQLTSGARDFLTRERIEILPADQARPERYRLLGGGYVEEKPEHMTHLNGEFLVPKDHPRILFRGKMDTLESELILCQLADKSLEGPVGEILALGELLLDFVPTRSDMRLSEPGTVIKTVSGSAGIFSCAAAALGARCGLLGKVGRDPFSRLAPDSRPPGRRARKPLQGPRRFLLTDFL